MNFRQIFTQVIYKLFQLLLLLFSVIVLSFILVKNSPVDPVQTYIDAYMMRLSQ